MKFTIVTPSLNQAAFIERTILSVLAQSPSVEVEHWILDGGSADGTVDILRRYEDRVHWSSARDGGQSAAINDGLNRGPGEMMAWLNSDDVYEPGALAAVAEAHYSMDYDYWLRLGRQWSPRYIDRTLAAFRWHAQSKNGAAYRAAARETFRTARRHARPGEGGAVFLHRLHVFALAVVYRCLE